MKDILRFFAICFVIFVGIVLFGLSHQLGGWRAFIVSSGSMEPSIPTGSLVISRYTHPRILQKNDIITFIAPIKDKPIVTHRIKQVWQSKTLATFKTKGDNNNAEDPWILAGGSVIGKIMLDIPYIGYFLSFIQTKVGILLFILLPSVYIIIDELHKVTKIIKTYKKNSTKKY